MKANPLRIAVLLAGVAVLVSGCSQRSVTPAPAPTQSPRPVTPAPPLPQPIADWRDAELTPGDWRWSREAGQSVARFGSNLLVMRCDRAAAAVRIERAGTASSQVAMSIVTQSITRPLSASPLGERADAVAAVLPARDPLLDAMAFSRGRFAVEVSGLTTLVVPSWPEIARVIEDCR